MEITTHKFKKNLPGHLNNAQLRRNMKKATWLTVGKREKMLNEFPEWEEWRESAHLIKEGIINNISESLEKFKQNAEKNGIHVLHAANAQEANQKTYEIIQHHGGNIVVKSKSMLTEEIALNEYLENRSLEVWETDLGEFIIQLAHEHPSHLIGPAIHKSKEEIAKLFHEKLGCNNDPTPEYLTKVAREYLREKFIKAEVGITGANFGIIEKGSVVLVENEGNIRLSYSAPKVHIILMGIEKLINNFEELSMFIPLLSVSGSGVKTTGYVSVVNGPRRKEELDGPEHVYVILVDNGRMNIWKDEKMRKALYCIRCSACYNTCPVYRNIGGHAYGWVYQGPIGAVITPHFVGLKKAKDLPYASSLCGSCTSVCPVKIPLHHLLLENRNKIIKKSFKFSPEAIVFKLFSIVMKVPAFYNTSTKMLKMIIKLFKIELKAPGWSKSRELPPFAEKSFKDWYKDEVKD